MLNQSQVKSQMGAKSRKIWNIIDMPWKGLVTIINTVIFKANGDKIEGVNNIQWVTFSKISKGDKYPTTKLEITSFGKASSNSLYVLG
jgi:hypothetical protein